MLALRSAEIVVEELAYFDQILEEQTQEQEQVIDEYSYYIPSYGDGSYGGNFSYTSGTSYTTSGTYVFGASSGSSGDPVITIEEIQNLQYYDSK